MDALGAFLKSKGLDGGGSTHPVTMPDFVLSYEDKDITADVAPYLISFSYPHVPQVFLLCRAVRRRSSTVFLTAATGQVRSPQRHRRSTH